MSEQMTWGDAARQWNLAYNGETEERPDYEPVPTDMSGADMPSVEQFPPGQDVQPRETDIAGEIGQAVLDVARPVVEPFLAGSPTENPVARGVAEAGLEKIPNSVMSLMNDVEQIIGTVPEGTEATKMPDIVGKSEQYPQAQELVSQFASFLGPFAAMRGFTAPLASLQSFEAGAVADFLMEPGQGGLATMARELGFDNELTQFLDSKVGPEEDSAAKRLEARAKQALEGAGITGVVEGGIKTVMNLFKAGKNYLTGTVFRNENFGPETPVDFQHIQTVDPMPPIRIEAKKRLFKANDLREAGLLSDKEVADEAANIVKDMMIGEQAKALKMEGHTRGKYNVISQLNKAIAKGKIEKSTGKFAEWLVNKNGDITTFLKMSFRKGSENSMEAGMYDPVSAVATVFKNKDAPTTAVHEILHHAEQMMPEGLRLKIVDLWKTRLTKELEAAWDAGDKKRYQLLIDQVMARAGDADAAVRVRAAYESKELTKARDYQFTNASEFWTENATNIFANKYGGFGWIKQAKEFVNGIAEFFKDRLGFDNDYALYQGVKKVLKGKQIHEGEMFADGPESRAFAKEQEAYLK